MWDTAKVVGKVRVNHIRVTAVHLLFHIDHRLLRIALWAIAVLLIGKVRLEDRFQHKHCCCHAHPIPDG